MPIRTPHRFLSLVCSIALLACSPPAWALGEAKSADAQPADATQRETRSLADRLERAFARETLGEFWGSVCVTQNGEVVWSTGIGYADPTSDEHPLEHITAEDALFDVGSIAKSFAAVAVLRLVDEGKATLDTPLRAIFEGVPESKAGITLGQLLSHTSGVPARFQMERSDTADHMLASMWDDQQQAEPGSAFAYSNANYFIAAAAIERLAGEPFEQAMHRLVFEPAGLTHTGLIAPASARPAEGTPTARRGPTGRRGSGTPSLGSLYEYPWNWGQRGATGVVSSARDLCRWADLLARGDLLSGGELLSDASREALLTPREGVYALGLYVEPGADGTPARLSHGGSTGGYRAVLVHEVAEGVSVAVLSHSEGEVERIADRLIDTVAPPPARPTVATVYLLPYTATADGSYEVDEGLDWRVMPEYRSAGMADKRPTIVVADAGNRFWPLIVRMDRDKALALAADARAAIEEVARDERAKSAPWMGGMSLRVDTRGRPLGEHRDLELSKDPRVAIRADGIDVVLEITPADADRPVAVVRMGGAETTQLIQGLLEHAD